MKELPLMVCCGLACGCAFVSQTQLEQRTDADNDTYVAVQYGGGDCNDADPSVHPQAVDPFYDGIDSNCDGASDYDQDGDGVDAYQYGGQDCDDADPELSDQVFWYPDADKDGYGATANSVQQCEGPPSYIRNGDDCNDSDGLIRPGSTEVCDGQDNNCDGLTDPDGSVGSIYFKPDRDKDGYGDADETQWVFACEAPQDRNVSYGLDASDCDDASDGVHPAAVEICNDLVDNNCNGDPDNCELTGFGYVNPTGSSSISSRAHAVVWPADDGTGPALNGQFGWWAGGVGDVNGDGLDDVMVSAPLDLEVDNKGRLYFFAGSSEEDGGLGLDSRESWGAESAALTYDGPTPQGRIGGTAEPLGDINGDGIDDFAVDNCGLGGASTAATVRLFLGGASFFEGGAEVLEISGVLGERGLKASDSFGCSLAVGDLNNDSTMDLIIGSTGERDGDGVGGGHSSGMGAVYVLLGPITASVDVQTEAIRVSAAETNLSGDVVGRNLASSGDMDGDGLDELAVSALVGDDNVGSGSGTVHLKYGHDWTTDLVLEDFDAQFTGDSSYGMAGEAIRFGDVNGDGYDDMAVTSPKHGSERGMVYVIHGRASPFQDDWSLWTANVRLRGHRSGDGVGQSLEMIRPLDPADPRPLDRERGVNGSDYADLWIGGAGQNPSETGYLIYGPLPDMTDVIGPHAAAQFQLSDVAHSAAPLRSAWDGHVTVRSAGDFNGDGYVDLLAGFPWHHTPDADPSDDTQDGLVSLFLGGGD